MKNLIICALFLPFIFTFSSFQELEVTKDGKTLFTIVHQCNECHAVKASEIAMKTKANNRKGSDLSGYEFAGEFREIAAYVRKEGELDGKTHKKPFKGTDEELQAIIDWLGSLEVK